MPDVRRVIVQIREPQNGADTGQISEGHYVIENGAVIMTNPAGGNLVDPDGSPVDRTLWRHQLRPGESADVVARMLTRRVRRAMIGITEGEDAFCRPLRYQNAGVA